MTPLDTLKESLAAGMDPNAWNETGITPLHYAALQGYHDCVQLLAVAGADLNAKTKNDGDTALHVSAEYGDLKTIEALIQAEADINLENDNGETPLFIAAMNGNLWSVERLLEAGALIEKMEIEGDPDSLQQVCVEAINKHFCDTMILIVPEK